MSTQRAAQAIYLVPVDLVAGEARFSSGDSIPDGARATREISLPGYDYDAWTVTIGVLDPTAGGFSSVITVGETPDQATIILPVSLTGATVNSAVIPDSPAQTPFRIPTGKLFLSRVGVAGALGVPRVYYRVTLWRYVLPSEARGSPPR